MVDWDSLLSYKTVKIISIRDSKLIYIQSSSYTDLYSKIDFHSYCIYFSDIERLGLLHYFFMFLIFVYVVGWTIVWQKRYLITAAPIGSIRLSLKEVCSID
jgi:hypothetical protein